MRPVNVDKRAIANGWRSGLEQMLSGKLTSLGICFDYEQNVVPYVQPEKKHKYTPDFVLANGVVIETKGRFLSADRQKHLLVQKQHPKLDIRFVFSNPNARISKQSDTTYAMWCETHGFKYAAAKEPLTWLAWAREDANPEALIALAALVKKQAKP